MKIFSDLHHSGLFYSLKLLFEDRLGHELYRPIGMEWFPEWWDIAKPYNNSVDTAKQFLMLKPEYTPKDGTPPLNDVVGANSGHYEVHEKAHDYIQKALTLEQFKNTDIDIIIASIPDHWITYEKLRQKYHPKAKLICQMGNIGWHNMELLKDGTVKNLMASVAPFRTKTNSVFYHQEIDLKVFYPRYLQVIHNKNINSFVIGLPDERVFMEYKEALPEYNLTAYASKHAPFIHTIKELSDKISDSAFIFNHKPHGDGFGHILYSSAFCGKPLLIDFKDYRDKLGGELLQDKVTAIDIGIRSVKENADLIRTLDPQAMGENIHKRVTSCVDYQKESEAIKEFFGRLV